MTATAVPASAIAFAKPPDPAALAAREFKALGNGHYQFTLLALGLQFDVDRLRRDRHELIGELTVLCDWPGARRVDGSLSVADFNLSSARARTDRARLLADRAESNGFDWTGLLEEFCQRVLAAERAGDPAVLLHTLDRPTEAGQLTVEGITLLRDHPVILFGDGGAAKSYLALYLAGQLSRSGVRVLFADWELCGDDHRDRLERLFGANMPHVFYARCDRPIVAEADRLARLVRQDSINYVVCDSVAFACDGPPEAAEVASAYFRAMRSIGVGSLHLAHITKGENGDQRPFGSTFWHNGARATWFVKLAAPVSTDGQSIVIGLFNRKANLGPLRPALGFQIAFDGDRTTFTRVNLADVPDLAAGLPVRTRIASALKRGPLTVAALVEEIEAPADTIRKTIKRNGSLFVCLEGGRIGLAERRF